MSTLAALSEGPVFILITGPKGKEKIVILDLIPQAGLFGKVGGGHRV